jgi:hypothetical protein
LPWEVPGAAVEISRPVDLAILSADDIVADAKRLLKKQPGMCNLFIGEPQWKQRLRRSLSLKSRWLDKPFTANQLPEANARLANARVLHAK